MSPRPPGSLVRRPAELSRRGLLTLLLVGAFGLSLLTPEWSLHTGGLGAAGEIMTAIVRMDLSPSYLLRVVEAAGVTLAYATTGMTVAVLLGVPAALVASGVLARARPVRLLTSGGARSLMAVLRAMDELVWALLFVQVFGFSAWTGVLGIGLPYAAIIGRVLAERLQDAPEEPLRALRSTGASEWQVLVYGRLPQIMADVVAYLSYRYECAVRAGAILSVVGLGGIGLEIDVALADLRFERVWTLAAGLTVLIVAVDALSARVRQWVVP